jgi:hypothetical protein
MGAAALLASVAAAAAISTTGMASAGDLMAEARTRVASHVGRIEGDRVTWRSMYVENASTDPSASRERLDLAHPFIGELDADQSPGVRAITDGTGAIVAIAVDPQVLGTWQRLVAFTVRAPLAREGATVVLAPPLARGEGIQRLDVNGPGDLRFEPASSDGLVKNVGSWSTAGIDETARRAASAELGETSISLDEAPIFVVATSDAVARGLPGTALTAAERARPGLILAGILFVVLAAACGLAYRLLGREAGIERAEAAIREDYERGGA